ncbi:hypothetical protein [Actinocorallia aurantiaca]|uniref:hypothetical protein n=1 Tax=Actinocorallia aurantiaca TaxID=46204 RepID=UPI0031CE44FD
MALLTGATGLPSPAFADHGGGGVTPDGIDQYFASAYLTANGVTAYNWGRSELARSALNVYSGSGDVLVRDWASQVHQNDFGWTECTDMTTYNACDKFDTVFNNLLMDSRSVNNWRSLGCHELGHGGNLDHRYASTDSDDNSCMRNEIWPLSLDTHDINEINADWSVPHAIQPGCLNNAC